MQKSSDGSNNFDEARTGNPRTDKPVVGDADNVQKTSYVVGQGTDPNASERRQGAPRGSTAAGPGASKGKGIWIAVGIAALIAAVYAAGVFG